MPFSSSNAPYPANEPLPSGNAFSVLVVEDQGSVRAALVAELRRAGVSDIFEAPEGQAALHLFKTHRPDLVLLDIKLPGQDGYWVAQQMRESEAGDWTPIIFLSGLDNELDVWRGIEVGGDDYLVKPVKPIVLMAKLRAMRRLLDMRRRLVAMSAELHLANQRLNKMVEVDALTIPGTFASGAVTFSDGTKAKWYLDQQGRLVGQKGAGSDVEQAHGLPCVLRPVRAARAGHC